MDSQRYTIEKYSVTFQNNGTLGIEFAPNTCDQVEYTGAIVKSIFKGSPADEDAKVVPGDVLVQVNNEDLSGGYETTTNILRLQGRPITLTFQRPVPPPGCVFADPIYEEEFGDGPVGLDLQKNSFEGQEYSGAVVKTIRPNSQAMFKTRLKLGHVLIAVNGKNLEHGFEDTMNFLKAQSRPMRLKFQDPTAVVAPVEKEYKVVFGEGTLGLDLQQNKWEGQEYSGAVVKQVLPNTQAHEEGRIKVGHVLVAINGHPLMVGFMDTMKFLKNTGRPIELQFHDPYA